MNQNAITAQAQLVGYVERITYRNEDNGFTVASVSSPREKENVYVVGILPSLAPGETISCTGCWETHAQHGRQFRIVEYAIEAPANPMAIQRYLESGMVRGIGPVYAEKIVSVFGCETLDIIDHSPQRLLEVEGIGPKRLDQILTYWDEQKTVRRVMVFLQGAGISPTLARKIYSVYGTQSVEKVSQNPYSLARDVFGVGFKKADAIAKEMGISHDAPQRISAGLEYVLMELSHEGHVCYPVDAYLDTVAEQLSVERDSLQAHLVLAEEEGRIVNVSLPVRGDLHRFVWAKPLYHAEQGIARELKRLLSHPTRLRAVDGDKALEWVQQRMTISLAPLQEEAVRQSVREKVHVITGGPGTGKSTITKAILRITEHLTKKIALCAPTGKAAKRLGEVTGKEAKTIHSLLQFDFKKMGFRYNADNPLDCDLLIVDEASMIDTYLMHHLLKALPHQARLILVGDVYQLPSVGPGSVLRDMIDSQGVAVSHLKEIFRQAKGSQIVVNAHRVNEGKFPNIQSSQESDFFFCQAEQPQDVLRTILQLVTRRIPTRYGFHPLRDQQVLAPMWKGMIGIHNLNIQLQKALNPQQRVLTRQGVRYGHGDKVMQTRNNYKKEVFNGEVGFVDRVDCAEEKLWVLFDEKEVEYSLSELDELQLSYAVSIHKYQGSECPCVILPVHTSHFVLLNRNILYTGITRGKQLVVLVGTTKALAIAVHNEQEQTRYTGLVQAIRELL